MTIHDQKEEGYITLKEASERFGYAPDYVGQLIRKGKIEGKQVYANVAWMTTIAAMEAYLAGQATQGGAKRQEGGEKSEPFRKFSLDRALEKIFSQKMTRYYLWVLRAAFVPLVFTLLLVFYFLSIVIDREFTQASERRLSERSAVLIVPSSPEPLSQEYTIYGKR